MSSRTKGTLPPSIILDPYEHAKNEVLVKRWQFTEGQRSEPKAVWILRDRREREKLGKRGLCKQGL